LFFLTSIGFARTTDGGETWTTTNRSFLSSILKTPILTYVPNTANTYIYAATDNIQTYTSFTLNGGDTWSPFVNAPVIYVGSIAFSSPRVGWLANGRVSAARRAVIYKWNPSYSLMPNAEIAEKGLLSISPYPSNGHFNVDWKTDGKRDPQYLQLFNALGQLVFEKKDAATSPQIIDLESLTNGIYLLQLKNREGVVAAQKVVIER